MSFIIKLISTILAMLFSTQYGGAFAPKTAEVRLNATLISDTHIDYRELYSQYVLKKILADVESSKPISDAFVVTGDITNYGDEKSLINFYDTLTQNTTVQNLIIASGNHDIGHVEDVSHDEARERFIKYYNQYTGESIENIYYSYDVNGYTFIILGDQSADNWDRPEYYEDQLAFLDSELQRATLGGKPAFVISHVPVFGVNGQDELWEDGCMREEYSNKTKAVLEKYRNVFFISGHLHAGLTGELTEEASGFCSVEKQNNVNYVNLPTVYLANRNGVMWGGCGYQMEVYDGEVLFRARNFESSTWYPDLDIAVTLDSAE